MSVDPTKIPIAYDPREQRMSGRTYHGNMDFNAPYISQITETLYVGGCTGGLILPGHILNIVSLYPWERYRIFHEMQSELYVRLYDADDQGMEQIDQIAAWVNSCQMNGPTLVHCQAGLNRSNLVAARALMLQGLPAEEAISLLREKRDWAVLCNKSFENWLLAQDS